MNDVQQNGSNDDRFWLILSLTSTLLKDVVGVLLEGTPADVSLTDLRLSFAGVAGVHDLHVWSLTSGVNAIGVLASIREHVTTNYKIGHVTVQMKSEPCGVGEAHC